MENAHMKSKEIQEAVLELKNILIQNFGADTELHLFGSAARGDYGMLSDIDILVLIPQDVTNSMEDRKSVV